MLKFVGPESSPVVPGFGQVASFLMEQFLESEAPPRIEAARSIADGSWQIHFPDVPVDDAAEQAGSNVSLRVAA